MYVSIQGRHLTVTPAIHEYVKNKLKKIKFYFDQIVHAHVVLSVIKNSQFAEVTISVERHHFHNKVATDDMYKSIDQLFDKLERQVVKHKESHGHAKVGVDKRKSHIEEVEEVKTKPDFDIEDHEIEAKPMSDLEALLQLRADNKARYIGYYNTQLSERPSFAEKIDASHYRIYAHDGHWEKKEVELLSGDRLQVNAIENIRIVTETIEHAADYIQNHPEECRLFRSVLTQTIMLLFPAKLPMKNGHFGIIRERVGT